MIKKFLAFIILIYFVLVYFLPVIFVTKYFYLIFLILAFLLFFFGLKLREKIILIAIAGVIGLLIFKILPSPFSLFLSLKLSLLLVITLGTFSIFIFLLLISGLLLLIFKKFAAKNSFDKTGIIIFAPYFYPHKGGLEQYSWETSTRLASLGQKIIVVSPRLRREKTREKIAKIEIIRLDSWDLLAGRWPLPKPNLRNWKLLKEVFKNQPKIAILNTRFFPLSLLGAVYSKFHNIKIIHIEHGTCYPELETKFKKILAFIYDQTFGRLVISLASQVIGISKAAAEFSQKLGAKKPIVIPNAVDIDFFKPAPKRKKKQINIVFIGRLIKAKGIHHLIEAFKNIKKANLKLKIIGNGNFKNELKKIAKKDKRIHFLGEKNQKQIRQILRTADIFVNPSYSEGLPTSVLEAGAMGLAIIATDVGGTRQIIKNNVSGFLVKSKDDQIIKLKLEELLKSAILRRRFGRNIREKIISEFDWQKNIKKLLKEIQNA